MRSRLFVITYALLLILFGFFSGLEGRAQQPAAPRPDEPPVVKTTTNLVTLNVSVTDPQGRFVTGLDAEHFEVYEDNVKQTIEFFSDEDAPVSIGIVFDISGSMRGRLNRSNIALRKFLDACHEEDEFFLVGFNHQPGCSWTTRLIPNASAARSCWLKPRGRRHSMMPCISESKNSRKVATPSGAAHHQRRAGQQQPLYVP